MAEASSSKTILIFGASSGIAAAFTRTAIDAGYRVILINRTKLKLDKLGINDKFVLAQIEGMDFYETANMHFKLKEIICAYDYQYVMIAQGVMPEGDYKFDDIVNSFSCNLISVAEILNMLFHKNISKRQLKKIVVLGSIAGDRGKEKNPIYDAAKAGVETLCEGFRQRFWRLGAELLLVKPGNVTTKMTVGKPKNFTWASSDFVGRAIFHAMLKSRGTVYIPRPWWLVMFIVRLIPERIFFKLGLGRAN